MSIQDRAQAQLSQLDKEVSPSARFRRGTHCQNTRCVSGVGELPWPPSLGAVHTDNVLLLL